MLIKDTENSFTATANIAGDSLIVSSQRVHTGAMDEEQKKPVNKGKGRVSDAEPEEDACQEHGELKPIVIDGGCLCSLVRYQINIPVEFQKSELYKQIVGFTHCYCHSCRAAVSALTRTSLKFPRDMVQWSSKAKIVEPEPETPASASSSRRRRSSKSGSVTAPIDAITEDTSPSAEKSCQITPSAPAAEPKQFSEAVHRKAARLQSTLEAVQQDPEFDTEFAGVDNAMGCCCFEEDRVAEALSSTAVAAESSKSQTLGKTVWSGNTGYHKRIWKRERAVGGKTDLGATSGVASPSISPAASTPKDASPSITPRTQSPAIEQSPKEKEKEKGKGKVKEGLWSKMKGKASAAISSKDKEKTKGKGKSTIPASSEGETQKEQTSKIEEPEIEEPKPKAPEPKASPEKLEIITGCDTIPRSSTAPQTASSLEILRWEAQLLHQQQTDLSQRSCTAQNPGEEYDGDPQNNTLPVPWPFKEFAITTRDGRTSYRGFCSWCGGTLTYRTTATIHGMVDIHVGSMDHPEQAMRDVGFLREVHIETAGEVEHGARLGTQVGNSRDGSVETYHSCDLERRLYVDSEDEPGRGDEEEVLDSDDAF